ncbi:atp18 subunit J of the mitochondrial F1F0 ATP synthase [Vermiconidia calcicola]|uniref:Atp18 subunit J of the mitochondrial F1F0 ATP synthase n=1 Tax=Vermiconidia calcicola TaxID=1690605 RepID=A0ACC3MJ09_9PEZI|nr:atp18 subunit J of the mitochondrial F1F0 ATP synthase [Vermiconidia calcicola]
MPGLLGKKFPAPVMGPMWPFYTAGTPTMFSHDITIPGAVPSLIIAYGINNFAGALANTDEYKNDPRNPARGAKNDAH